MKTKLSSIHRTLHLALLATIIPALCAAQSAPKKTATRDKSTGQANLEAARQNPLALRAFLYKFPKGADLHMHLSGAIYAETFIRDAAEDNLCVDTGKLAFAHEKRSDATTSCG